MITIRRDHFTITGVESQFIPIFFNHQYKIIVFILTIQKCRIYVKRASEKADSFVKEPNNAYFFGNNGHHPHSLRYNHVLLHITSFDIHPLSDYLLGKADYDIRTQALRCELVGSCCNIASIFPQSV